MTSQKNKTVFPTFSTDISKIGEINPDLAGEMLLIHLPKGFSTNCRFSAKSLPCEFSDLSEIKELSDTDKKVSEKISEMINPEGEIEIQPWIVKLKNGIYAAYLCDHDSDIIIMIPEETKNFSHFSNAPEHFLTFRNTDAKKSYGWVMSITKIN